MSNNKYKVLIIEDESNIRSFVQTVLEASGYQVLTEKSCENGIMMFTSHLPDVVILDPPRKGCDEQLLRFLAEREVPRIVYVSCGPDSLARDCAVLRNLGYEIGTVTPVDLFPRTGHVESVVSLTRGFDVDMRR